jgi:hypothetical protein
VLSLVGFAVIRQQSSQVSGPLKAEQCIGTRFEANSGKTVPSAVRVSCEDAGAKGKVLKITREGRRSSFQFGSTPEPDCPEGTDGVARVSLKSGDAQYFEACVRNLKAPHPGDPGAGGAMIAKGDCVSSASFGFGGEKPCSGDYYGKVIARVDSDASCPAPQTQETMKLRSFGGGSVSRPVLCLGQGGGVLGAGDCIQDPSFAVGGLRKADCGTAQAVAKVAARAKARKDCPAGATHVMESSGAYLPVMCLQKLRATPLERLEELTG